MNKKKFTANDPVVHHINGNHDDNRNSNLMCLTRRDHVLLHHAQKDIYPNKYTLICSKNKKKEILKVLKERERCSTTEVAHKIKSDIWMAKQYLEHLEQEGKITKEQETNSCYWSLK